VSFRNFFKSLGKKEEKKKEENDESDLEIEVEIEKEPRSFVQQLKLQKERIDPFTWVWRHIRKPKEVLEIRDFRGTRVILGEFEDLVPIYGTPYYKMKVKGRDANYYWVVSGVPQFVTYPKDWVFDRRVRTLYCYDIDWDRGFISLHIEPDKIQDIFFRLEEVAIYKEGCDLKVQQWKIAYINQFTKSLEDIKRMQQELDDLKREVRDVIGEMLRTYRSSMTIIKRTMEETRMKTEGERIEGEEKPE